MGTDLGDYRKVDDTYGYQELGSLPPLPTQWFDGSFGWLAQVPIIDPKASDIGWGIEIDYMRPIEAVTVLPALGPNLPAAFTTLMSRPELLAAVPSCTACWWGLSKTAVPCSLDEGGELVRFLNDQQGCCHWYLHLLPDGGHRVLCGGLQYDAEQVGADEAAADLLVVAPDFESFVYRFWVENLAWYGVVGAELGWTELSTPVRDYLGHYRQGQRSVDGPVRSGRIFPVE
ncbi:hypothetical protein GCM10022225_28870 [Plantactinospora mayteni]|uniref:DUF4262 domain-containing protein n=1 Tax=Plantactinospora mayteni TaxID=566021 RepID=A0ABQ4ETA5_9ACTN|nr:hypothetical protein Pma05_44220 [Plantactinospora mayteni]